MGKKLNSDFVASVMLTNNLKPLVPFPGAGKPWKVKCKICGTLGSPTYAHVKSRGGGCRTCGIKRTSEKRKLDPIEAVQYMRSNGYEPLELYRGTKYHWKCLHLSCGRVVSPKYENIAIGQGGCVECGRISAAAIRRLDSSKVTEEIIKKGFRPLDNYPGTKKRWLCECIQCQKEFTTSLESIRKGAHPLCTKCNRNRMGKLRRISKKVAISCLEKVGLTSTQEFPGTKPLWNCKCKICGKKTQIQFISVQKRIAKNSKKPMQGCESCVFKSIGKDRILSQSKVNSRLAELKMRPLELYTGTNKLITSICLVCGSENKVNLSKAYSRGRACSSCSLKSRGDFFRKPEHQARTEMLEKGFRPLEPYRNTNSPWRSIHLECQSVVSPSLSSIRKQSGCSHCAKYGFDSSSPAYLYLLENSKLNAIKVGITGIKTTRLERLAKQHQWKLIAKYRFETGAEAKQYEQVVLCWWREDLCAPPAITSADSGILGGWTETASINIVSTKLTVKFIKNILP